MKQWNGRKRMKRTRRGYHSAKGMIEFTILSALWFNLMSSGARHLEGSLHAEALEVHRPQRTGSM
jgi:hypothetical protein